MNQDRSRTIDKIRIGELARWAGINPRTLRYYERIGLLVPSARTDAGYRLYTEQDARRLTFIRRAQALGLSLAEIADIIAIREAGTAPCRHVRAVAQEKVAVVDECIAELRALRDELTRLAERAEAVETACVEGSSICLAVEGVPPSP
jgi:DNA-binding transcriptional MerR regulator